MRQIRIKAWILLFTALGLLHPHALAQMGKESYKDNFWDWPDRSKKDPDIYYREKSYKQVERTGHRL